MPLGKEGPVVAGTGALYTVNKSGRDSGINTLREALGIEAECGCGIDCCNGQIVIPDTVLNTNTFWSVDNGVFNIRNAAGGIIFSSDPD